MTKRPNSMRHLDDAIRRECGGAPDAYVRLRTLMANAIVAHMLPDGVVKGGSAIKMRLGDKDTRFTTDLDTATPTDPDAYAEALSAALAKGWEGFTGRLVAREPAHPSGVPQEYVMRPFEVKLSYLGKPWCTVTLEVGFNEIGDAEAADWIELADVARVFANMGFPPLGKVPLMPLSYQVAQKLHAVTDGGDRVRDLIDLQLIAALAELDFFETRRICVRLFAYRKGTPWPPVVTARDGWDNRYETLAQGLPVLHRVEDAVEWTNDLIARIDKSIAATGD